MTVNLALRENSKPNHKKNTQEKVKTVFECPNEALRYMAYACAIAKAAIAQRLIRLIDGPGSRNFDAENSVQLFEIIELANGSYSNKNTHLTFVRTHGQSTLIYRSRGSRHTDGNTIIIMTILDTPNASGEKFWVEIDGDPKAVQARHQAGLTKQGPK